MKKSKWIDYKPAGYDPYQQDEGYYLDEDAGQKIINFFHDCLTHVRGPLKGLPFELDLWQQAIIGHLYGWKSEVTNLRRYRELLLLIARKNGKSMLGAGIAIVEMFLGDPNTPEAIVASGDREQARQMFDTCKIMINQEPELESRLQMYKNIIKNPKNDGFLRVVSSEAYNLHGANLSLALIDETHIVSRDLVEVLQTSQGSRQEPLICNLSTAGYDRHSILFEKYDYGKKVRDNLVNDPAFMPVIYEADKDADFKDPKVWKIANPCLGVSISKEYLTRECERAKESPVYENTFRRLHINQWTEQETRFLSMDKYDECVIDLPDLTGKICYGGLDLASTTDLAALSLCFPIEELFYVLSFAWIPNDTIITRSRRDRVPYQTWRDQGIIESTPGNCIDYSFILAKIDELAQKYDIQAILFDRWGATMVVQQLQDRNVEVIDFGQGYASMSMPTKELEKLILGKQIFFSENPALRWNFGNLVIEQDAAGNIKPSKRKSTEKIDMVVATVMSLDGALKNKPKVIPMPTYA